MGAAACGGGCQCPVVKRPEFAAQPCEQAAGTGEDALEGALRGLGTKEPHGGLDLRRSFLGSLSSQHPCEDTDGPEGFVQAAEADDASSSSSASEARQLGATSLDRRRAVDNGFGDDGETDTEPEPYLRPRGGAICCEPVTQGYYKEPSWNKQAHWEKQLFQSLRGCTIFRHCAKAQLTKLVHAMEVHLREKDQLLFEAGDDTDGLFVVLEGSVACYEQDDDPAEDEPLFRCVAGEVIDEQALLWSMPRKYTTRAAEECTLGKLRRQDYVNLCTRHAFYQHEDRVALLGNSKLLETMDDESLATLADVLHVRSYEEGERIIVQGEIGHELFILTAGEASVTIRTADDEQEHMRYYPGSLFGEVALLTHRPRATTITVVNGPAEVLFLHRRQFERLFGSMEQLQAQQYLRDPRKLIADFYSRGDSRGPAGSLRLRGLEPEAELPETAWFAVYRPTSREAVAKMLSGVAVGKGLNVKGKSAKQGVLSGFVPFVQISDNKHRQLIEKSPATSRLTIFYRSEVLRMDSRRALEKVFRDMQEFSGQEPADLLAEDDSYSERGTYGLVLPEALLREAYIMRQDLSPVMGWETGRRSEPAFMDANLHAIRGGSEPRVVLYQYDETDGMNPRGLLIAYAEEFVKPVVSDFDTFLVGSRGMIYEPLPREQADLVMWMLDNAASILRTPDHNAWTARWLQVLKKAAEEGFHPDVPRFGFGDPTSYRLIQDVVAETTACGAIRHGAECSNFYFPQELDEEYLIVWHSFPDKPWSYRSEAELRAFLLARVAEGYSFPLNPVWPIRDPGWYDVLTALRASNSAKSALAAWYPPQVGILERVEEIRQACPGGFSIL